MELDDTWASDIAEYMISWKGQVDSMIIDARLMKKILVANGYEYKDARVHTLCIQMEQIL